MPAPIRPNTEAATAATKRRGDDTAAARLRAAGWTVLPPGGMSYPRNLRRNGKQFHRTVTTWADGSQLLGPWIEGEE